MFSEHPEGKDISFIPSNSDIEVMESALRNELKKRISEGTPVKINVLGKEESLETRLKYYKRRYFGRVSIEGEKFIKTEYVFIRCAGNDKWKNIHFTSELNKECWWSTNYSLERNLIISIKVNE